MMSKSYKLDEKWRPKKITDFVGNGEVLKDVWKMVQDKNITHLLFSGQQGTGKTSLALVIVKTLYGKMKHRYIEINASDENGIDIIRTKVKEYAKNSGSQAGVDFRVIIMDEADEITPKAMAALRRIMEKYYEHCRFILICNYKWKIIPPIQSRCSKFDFLPVTAEEMKPRLAEICEAEGIQVTGEALDFVASEAGGDVRTAFNTYLEKCRRFNHPVGIDDMRKMDVDREVVERFLKDALNGRVSVARETILSATKKGSNLRRLLMVIAKTSAENKKYPEMMKADVFLAALKADESVVAGTNTDLVVGGLTARVAASGEKYKK